MLKTDANLTKPHLLVFTEIGDKFKFINKTKKRQKRQVMRQQNYLY